MKCMGDMTIGMFLGIYLFGVLSRLIVRRIDEWNTSKKSKKSKS